MENSLYNNGDEHQSKPPNGGGHEEESRMAFRDKFVLEHRTPKLGSNNHGIHRYKRNSNASANGLPIVERAMMTNY
ncbi:hypothetical protein CR513_31148, partial [Mucuna pruriens]